MTERELRALAAYVDLPEERDLAPAVRARLRGRPARRGWIVVAFAAALVAVAAAFAVPPARSAILRFFHLQGATIELVDELPPVHPPTTLDLGIRIDPADAERTAGFRPLESSLLGRPDEVTWDGGLLWYRYGHVRLLVSQGVGRERSDLVKKVYEPGTTHPRRRGRRRAGLLPQRRAAPRLPRPERPLPRGAGAARRGRAALAARPAADADRRPVHGGRGAADRAQLP